MTGYIILGVFIAFVVGCFVSFLTGYGKGKKSAEAEYAEDLRRKEQLEKDYRQTKEEIKQEVFNESEKEKAKFSSGSGRDRFNNINDSLQNNPKR